MTPTGCGAPSLGLSFLACKMRGLKREASEFLLVQHFRMVLLSSQWPVISHFTCLPPMYDIKVNFRYRLLMILRDHCSIKEEPRKSNYVVFWDKTEDLGSLPSILKSQIYTTPPNNLESICFGCPPRPSLMLSSPTSTLSFSALPHHHIPQLTNGSQGPTP